MEVAHHSMPLASTDYSLPQYTRASVDTATALNSGLPAEDITALEEHLKKVGAVEVAHNPPPTATTERSLSDGEKADFLVKLMSHVRLHFLYLAEKLQEQLVAPQGEMATAGPGGSSNGGQVTQPAELREESDPEHSHCLNHLLVEPNQETFSSGDSVLHVSSNANNALKSVLVLHATDVMTVHITV